MAVGGNFQTSSGVGGGPLVMVASASWKRQKQGWVPEIKAPIALKRPAEAPTKSGSVERESFERQSTPEAGAGR